jgi:hypothetical protein
MPIGGTWVEMVNTPKDTAVCFVTFPQIHTALYPPLSLHSSLLYHSSSHLSSFSYLRKLHLLNSPIPLFSAQSVPLPSKSLDPRSHPSTVRNDPDIRTQTCPPARPSQDNSFTANASSNPISDSETRLFGYPIRLGIVRNYRNWREVRG